MRGSRYTAEEHAAFAARVARVGARIARELPHLDPDDVSLIVQCMLQKPEDRRYFLRELRPGVHGF